MIHITELQDNFYYLVRADTEGEVSPAGMFSEAEVEARIAEVRAQVEADLNAAHLQAQGNDAGSKGKEPLMWRPGMRSDRPEKELKGVEDFEEYLQWLQDVVDAEWGEAASFSEVFSQELGINHSHGSNPPDRVAYDIMLMHMRLGCFKGTFDKCGNTGRMIPIEEAVRIVTEVLEERGRIRMSTRIERIESVLRGFEDEGS